MSAKKQTDDKNKFFLTSNSALYFTNGYQFLFSFRYLLVEFYSLMVVPVINNRLVSTFLYTLIRINS